MPLPSFPLCQAEPTGSCIRSPSPQPRFGPSRAAGRKSPPKHIDPPLEPLPAQFHAVEQALERMRLQSLLQSQDANGSSVCLRLNSSGRSEVYPTTEGSLAAAALRGETSAVINGIDTSEAPAFSLDATSGVNRSADDMQRLLNERLTALAMAEAETSEDSPIAPSGRRVEVSTCSDKDDTRNGSKNSQSYTEDRSANDQSSSVKKKDKPAVQRLFSRGLTSAEETEVRALLEPGSRLKELVRREFTWAMSAALDGSATLASSPSSAVKSMKLGYSGAIIALRQLSYLNGLPALEIDIAFKLFDMHSKGSGSSSKSERSLSMEEFEAVFVYILRSALESLPATKAGGRQK